MSATSIARPRRPAAVLSLAALALLIASGAEVRADEVIRFKNGHSLTVRSTRVEGESVHVVLPNGSEASFPRSIVKLTESGVVAAPSSPNVAVGYSGRGPRAQELLGNVRGMGMMSANQAGATSANKVLAEGNLNSNGGRSPQTVGFSRWGSDAIGVPTPGSEQSPKVSIASSRPRRGGNGQPGTAAQPGDAVAKPPGAARQEGRGPVLASPGLTNPAERSHGHN
ncbi:MAG: hypothetical protein MUC67_03570 [Acidobacteria bacterium]|jgi:hypothetical protein|nr:hypothetical protein [Acidobacteriota bacterium]MCU0254060.1 hypothetical protein [Acidobacteriota bacterium]